jgi:hypothetical protein
LINSLGSFFNTKLTSELLNYPLHSHHSGAIIRQLELAATKKPAALTDVQDLKGVRFADEVVVVEAPHLKHP